MTAESPLQEALRLLESDVAADHGPDCRKLERPIHGPRCAVSVRDRCAEILRGVLEEREVGSRRTVTAYERGMIPLAGAAAIAGMSDAAALRMAARRGALKVEKVGRDLFVARSELDRYLRENRRPRS